MTSNDSATPEEVITDMGRRLDSGRAAGMEKRIQFDLSGEQGGKWWLKILDGAAETGRGEIESADLTLIASAEDYVQIALGKMEGSAAFMSGKLRINGDMALAMSFATLFKRPD